MHEQRSDRSEFNPSPERLDQVQIRLSVIDGGLVGDERIWVQRGEVATNDQLRAVVGELAVKARRGAVKQGERD